MQLILMDKDIEYRTEKKYESLYSLGSFISD